MTIMKILSKSEEIKHKILLENKCKDINQDKKLFFRTIYNQISTSKSLSNTDLNSILLYTYKRSKSHKDTYNDLLKDWFANIDTNQNINYKVNTISNEVFYKLIFESVLFTFFFRSFDTYSIPLEDSWAKIINDLVNGSGELITNYLKSNINKKDKKEIKKTLTDLQMIIGLGKNAYEENTLNYKMFGLLQDKIISLINNNEEIQNIKLEEILSSLEALVSSRKKLSKFGIKDSVILEDTGKQIGRLRLYQIK